MGKINIRSNVNVSLGINLNIRSIDLSSSTDMLLQVSSANSRYFEDQNGNFVFLTGSHTWNNLVDMDASDPVHEFDYDSYLTFLQGYGHNCLRLWAWEVTDPESALYTRRQVTNPQPWPRTGPGTDINGRLRFDLSQFNQSYFDRMRERVIAARDLGIWVIVMLFEGWAVQNAPGATSHPFNPSNNINSVDYSSPSNVHTLNVSEITTIQEAYVDKVIATIGDLDNVIWEIANEAVNNGDGTDWQYHFINYIEIAEASNQLQHPIGMTRQYFGGNTNLTNSDAAWIAPQVSGDTGGDPSPWDGSKVVIHDNDHEGGSAGGSVSWAWRRFCRGAGGIIFMDRYVPPGSPDSVTDTGHADAVVIRETLGYILSYAQRIDFTNVVPSSSKSSTSYGLHSPSYHLIFDLNGSTCTVDLSESDGITLAVEYFNADTYAVSDGGTISGGSATEGFTSPFGSDPTIIYLEAT